MFLIVPTGDSITARSGIHVIPCLPEKGPGILLGDCSLSGCITLQRVNVLLSSLSGNDRESGIDDRLHSLAVQMRDHRLNSLVGHVVGVLRGGHGKVAVQDGLRRGDLAVEAEENGVGVSRIFLCCTGSRNCHIVASP